MPARRRMHSVLPAAHDWRAVWIQFHRRVAIFRQFPVDAALRAAACFRCGLRRRARNDAALSCSGTDGNQRAEVCLGHAPVGNVPILAETCRRCCRLCDCPAGGTLGARIRHACRILERAGSADLQRTRGRSGRWAVSAGKRSMAVSVRCVLHDDGQQRAFRCAGDRGLGPRRGPARGALAMGQPGCPAASGPRAPDPARSPDDLTPQTSRAV